MPAFPGLRPHSAWQTAVLAVVAGALLRLSVGLTPVWWLVWLAPVPLLLLAFAAPRGRATLGVFVAALIGTSANVHYFSLVMPWPAVALSVCGQALIWMFVVMTTRRIVLATSSLAAVLVYPVLWVAVDCLFAAVAPDGNWGSLAYTQSDVLPLVQLVSLTGVDGLLFLLCLLPSIIAVLIWRRPSPRDVLVAGAPTAVALVAALAFGFLRLQTPVASTSTRDAMVSVDDPIGPQASPAYSAPIRAAYDALVARAAAGGAQLIVLPEKIATLMPDAAVEWQAHFAALAADHHVWLEVGLGIAEGAHPRNYAWLFDPQGHSAERYEKHFLAPPERRAEYASGNAFTLHEIDGRRVGLAICKDMHFATLGRDYGVRDAAVMLVPAWDFGYLDAWLESRTTVLRGIENGYAVIRASREGWLTASDAYGRIVAEAPSAELPGALLLADLPIGARVPTLYTSIGNAFGWLCFAVVVVVGFANLRRRKHRSHRNRSGSILENGK